LRDLPRQCWHTSSSFHATVHLERRSRFASAWISRFLPAQTQTAVPIARTNARTCKSYPSSPLITSRRSALNSQELSSPYLSRKLSAKPLLPLSRIAHTHIVDLAAASIHSLQQLIHLLIAHLLAQICQDIPELPNTNEARQILVEHLESATVLLRLAGIAEAVRTVEDAGEGVVVDWIQSAYSRPRFECRRARSLQLTITAHLPLQLLDLCQRRVLPTRPQQVAQVVQRDAAVAALVEEGEGLLEVGALRLCVRHLVLATASLIWLCAAMRVVCV